MEFFDSHAHYNDEKFNDDREETINQIYQDGITKMVVAGYSLEASKMAVELANTHTGIYSTVRNITKRYKRRYRFRRNRKTCKVWKSSSNWGNRIRLLLE